jgi:hypothetical protein
MTDLSVIKAQVLWVRGQRFWMGGMQLQNHCSVDAPTDGHFRLMF